MKEKNKDIYKCLLGILENHPTELTDNAFSQLIPVLKEILSNIEIKEELLLWDNAE